MSRHLALVPLAVLAACATPDLGPDITDAAKLLATTEKDLQPTLQPLAQKEQAAAELAMMQGGNFAVGLEGSCSGPSSRAEGRALSDCDLVTLSAPPDQPISASQMLEALDGLTGYYSALAALASTQSSDAVATQTTALIGALSGTGMQANVPAALAQLGARAAASKDAIVTAAGYLAGQYRMAALRRVITRADPVIGELTGRAVAWLLLQPQGLTAAEARLTAARSALTEATAARNLAAQIRATAELRAAFAAFKAAESTSPAVRLLLLRQMHADLLTRLNSPQSVEGYLKTIGQIQAIAALAQRGK